MNPIAAVVKAPFVVLNLAWQITLMLVRVGQLTYALATLGVIILKLLGRVMRNTYYRWR